MQYERSQPGAVDLRRAATELPTALKSCGQGWVAGAIGSAVLSWNRSGRNKTPPRSPRIKEAASPKGRHAEQKP